MSWCVREMEQHLRGLPEGVPLLSNNANEVCTLGPQCAYSFSLSLFSDSDTNN